MTRLPTNNEQADHSADQSICQYTVQQYLYNIFACDRKPASNFQKNDKQGFIHKKGFYKLKKNYTGHATR